METTVLWRCRSHCRDPFLHSLLRLTSSKTKAGSVELLENKEGNLRSRACPHVADD